MKRMLLLSVLLVSIVSTNSFATRSIQQISVTNTLGNTNATGGVPGLTQTAVGLEFNNGGSSPCLTTIVAYGGFFNMQVGTGQACVAAVTSVAIKPVVSPAGTVYSVPPSTTLNTNYYSNQILVSSNTAPTFDSSNGTVVTPGTVTVTYQGT
jgi:hypothetical protein